MTKKLEVTKEEIHFRGMFMSLFIDIEFILANLLCTLLIKNEDDVMSLQEFITPTILLHKKY